MSGRGRLGTVLRVAELRERVSRGAATADAAAARVAAGVEQQRRAELTSLPSDADVRTAAARAAMRAGAVLEAARETGQARTRSALSAAEHVAAVRRTELLADLVARRKAEHEAAVVAAEQRLVDDLGRPDRREDRS